VVSERKWSSTRARASLLKCASEVLVAGDPEAAHRLATSAFVAPSPADDEDGFRTLMEDVFGQGDSALDSCVAWVYGPEPFPPLAAFAATLHRAGNGTDRFVVACSNTEGDQCLVARRTVIRDMISNEVQVWVTVEPIQEGT
jgi:hypothetical protein